MKLKIIYPAICAIFISIAISANMRAPYILTYKTSSALKPVKGVKVLSEKLTFEFSDYASGKISSVIDRNYNCRIIAEYNIESSDIISAEMEFISPSIASIEIRLNNSVIPYHTQVLSEDDNDTNWRRQVQTLYSIKFTGSFRKQNNKIIVSYTQPVSVYETAYGYFQKSRYSSSVDYEFWPLKEWELDEKFTAAITISVPYKWKISDYVTNPDINLEIEGSMRESEQNKTKYKGIESHKQGIYTKTCELSGLLPDMLNISINED